MSSPRLWLRLRDALWLLVLAAYILAGTPDVPFHGDESTTIWMSRDYGYIVLEGDLARVTYNDPPLNATEQHLRLVAAPLTRYLYGAAWHLRGYTTAEINEQWDWGADWAYNQTNGHAPSRDLLLTARWVSALFLAGSMVIVFLIARHSGGVFVAYLASLYYTLNPALLLNGRRAMMEGPSLFFGLLVVLAGILLLKQRSWWSALLLGLAAGLAVAAKHPNLLIVVAAFAACGFVAIRESTHDDDYDDSLNPPTIGPRDPYYLLIALFVAFGLGAAIFLALNPVLWDDPVARVGQVIEERTSILDVQMGAFGSYAGFVDQVAGGLRQIFLVPPQYYEDARWSVWIAGEINAYESSPWAGVALGGTVAGGMIVAALLLAGWWALLRSYRLWWEVKLLLALWSVSAVLVPLAINPLEWQRYYLLAYPAVGVLGSLGLVWIMRSAYRRFETARRDALRRAREAA